MNRRRFLHRAGVAGVTLPLHALLARASSSAQSLRGPGYGPLAPVEDRTTGLRLLWLPEGFSYFSFGWTKDLLDDGTPTPRLHDGMGCYPVGDGVVRLIRNHELNIEKAFAPKLAFDPYGGGGTTTVDVHLEKAKVLRSVASLAGTVRNCAGGVTPWGSWLTCEETLLGPGPQSQLEKPHGWVFEVPLDGEPSLEPLRAMGRFTHEAVAVDPATGIVYETEDRGRSGFYRFTPRVRGRLSLGGALDMLRVKDVPQADLRTNQRVGAVYPVEWVPIADPERAHVNDKMQDSEGVFQQGYTQGAAFFARLEGAWHSQGSIYFIATSGGNEKCGQVWAYTPAAETLRLIYESPSQDVLDMPDNLCASPRGGLLLCEDGGGADFVRGLTVDGQIFDFVRNGVVLNGERNGIVGDYRDSELAGVTFSPDGRWLLLNIQTPGISMAITGPWQDGPL